MNYTSPVPADHPEVIFWIYLVLIFGMWLVLTLSVVTVWPLSGFVVAVINVTVGLLTRNRVWDMRERISQ